MPIICFLVRENHKMVREMSGKSQGILWGLMAGHPGHYSASLGYAEWNSSSLNPNLRLWYVGLRGVVCADVPGLWCQGTSRYIFLFYCTITYMLLEAAHFSITSLWQKLLLLNLLLLLLLIIIIIVIGHNHSVADPGENAVGSHCVPQVRVAGGYHS